MDTNLDSNYLLQEILAQLRTSNQSLGFGHSPKARYIYANRKYPDALWYFWNSAKDEHEPIEFNALTGMIECLEIEEKQYKGKQENKVNLHIRADRNYVIQAGVETLFAKGLLYTLSKLPIKAFSQAMTITVEPGETDQVLFCRIYNPTTGQAVYAPYAENTNWQAVTQRAVAKVDASHGRGELPQKTA